MFTSRAEFRMLLRQDNADIRLTELSHSIGLASKDRYSIVKTKLAKTKNLIKFITNLSVLPAEINPILENKSSKPITQSMKLKKLYSRPNIVSEDVLKINSLKEFIQKNNVDEDVIEQAEIQIKYSGYIQKERANAEKLNNLESIYIPEIFDYGKLKSLSAEAKSKLEEIRPKTLSQASRISGVSPADISAMLVYMGR
jgi:tRNA uridine 5-carboxymethylaminomethyl modification enzyme